MTKAFAIALLKQDIQNSKQKISYYHNEVGIEALELAIKALEQQPCEDCISREAVKEMLSEEWTKYMPMELDINLSFVMEKINELPSVTPQQRVGKWMATENEDMNIVGYYCSCCDLPMETEEKTTYCPNCGAKMEVEE